MCGEKGYYFSNFNLKDNDIVIVTFDPDIVDFISFSDDFERISNMFKPHLVFAVEKGIELSREDKDKFIKYLQEN